MSDKSASNTGDEQCYILAIQIRSQHTRDSVELSRHVRPVFRKKIQKMATIKKKNKTVLLLAVTIFRGVILILSISIVFLLENLTGSQEVLILSSSTVIAMIMIWQTSFSDQTQDYRFSNTR